MISKKNMIINMNKRLLSLGLLLLLYIGTLALYIVFLVRDFAGLYFDNTIGVKYAIVITSAVFTLFNLLYIKEDRHRLSIFVLHILAMICTVIADYFLLVTATAYETGVGFFIVTQLCYAGILILRKEYGFRDILIFGTCRLTLPVIAMIVMSSMKVLSLLYALTAIYFIQLVFNFIENVYLSIIAKDKSLRCEHIILSVGFLLFIGCDICVGLSNLGVDCWKLIWLFYAPSQVLLCSSYVLTKTIYHDEEREN